MQKTNNILIKAALTVFAAVLATGCISEKYDMPDNLQSVMVRLDMSQEPMTKADPTADELTINSVRIYAFREESLVGYFYRDHASTLPIYIDLRLPDQGIYTVDFYVVANEEAMNLTADSQTFAEKMTKSQFNSVRFQSFKSAADYGIPMYGIQSADIDVTDFAKDEQGNTKPNTAAGHEGHYFLNQKVTVGLYRPVAKLSVMASKQSEGTLIIDEVRMLAKGTRQYGYLFPATTENLQAIEPRANDRVLAGSVSVDKVLAAPTLTPDDYTDLTAGGVYLAEVPYGSEAWNEPVADNFNSVVLQIKHSAGQGTQQRTDYVYMPPMLRNNHYKVLCSISAEGNLSINYIVEDWEDALMWQDGLVFDYPNHSFLWPNYQTQTPSSTAAVMSTLSPFVAYFRMEYPQNETFNPTLLDGVASDYKVEVYDGATLLEDSDDFVSADKWYTIKVVPLNPNNVGNAVRLAVTYHASWSESAEFLIINGTSPNYVWPYSGNAFTQDSEYVIITQQ